MNLEHGTNSERTCDRRRDGTGARLTRPYEEWDSRIITNRRELFTLVTFSDRETFGLKT